MTRKVFGLVSSGAWIGLAVVFAAHWAQSAPPANHPNIRNAIIALREARQELQEARHDFCGRRAGALRDTQAALDQLERALDCNP